MILIFAAVSTTVTTGNTLSIAGLHFSLENLISFILSAVIIYLIAPILVRKYEKKLDEKTKKQDEMRKAENETIKKTLEERDSLKAELDEKWHTEVINRFKSYERELAKYCGVNENEHDSMWARINKHGHVLKCDNPECHGVEVGRVIITEESVPHRRLSDITK